MAHPPAIRKALLSYHSFGVARFSAQPLNRSRKGDRDMNTTRRILGLVLVLCVAGLPGDRPRTLAQQNSTAPDIEQQFFDAIKKGDSERIGELLKRKPALIRTRTKNGTTPVLLARYANHKELAESLLATGIEPNIFEASALGRLEQVRMLLRNDPALAKAFSPDGWTALHLNWGNTQIAELLLDSGANINAVSKNRFMATPLQSAVAAKWSDAAKLLIARKANVNCRGDDGGSPLHEAAGSGQLEIAKLLVAQGANLNARTDGGKTPLTIAIEFKQPEMEKFLREHKATQ